MRSTDYISKGTAVARLYKAKESLLMDKDCRKGLCFYLRGVDILDYLEDNRIWYQMWLTDLEKGCIDRYFLDMEVKAWWMINLQRWYVFFYEKNGRKVRGVLGKDRTKNLLRSIL